MTIVRRLIKLEKMKKYLTNCFHEFYVVELGAHMIIGMVGSMKVMESKLFSAL